MHRRSLVASACALLCLIIAVALISCPAATRALVYTCANGTAQTGTPTGSTDVEQCTACRSGYTLQSGYCLPILSTVYTCANGTPAVGSPGGTADVELCIMCNDGYHHEGNACAINTYECPKDSAFAPGTTGGTHGTEYCEACDDDYYLTRTGARCSDLGAAFRVGMATRFGQNVDATGLAAIGSTLYMSASTSTIAALYTVDITAGSETLGKATRVGGTDTTGDGTIDTYPDFFGVDERDPTDLAAIGSTLYMLGGGTERHSGSLYIVDTSTGMATLVGTKKGELDEVAPTGLAALNGTLYMVGRETGYLSTVSTSDGDSGRVGVSAFGETIGEQNPQGLAVINGVLYMAARSNPFFLIGEVNAALYTVATAVEKEGDEVTRPVGEARQVGSARNFFANGHTGVPSPTGLAAVVTDSGTTLYMTDGNNLYRLEYE